MFLVLGQNFGFQPIQLNGNIAIGGLDHCRFLLRAVIDDNQSFVGGEPCGLGFGVRGQPIAVQRQPLGL